MVVEMAGVDAPANPRRAEVIKRLAKRMYPNLRLEGATQWMGRRPSMPDGLPVIGPSPRHENLWLAFGHGHTGMVAGPMTGRIIAGMITGAMPNIDVAPFRAIDSEPRQQPRGSCPSAFRLGRRSVRQLAEAAAVIERRHGLDPVAHACVHSGRIGALARLAPNSCEYPASFLTVPRCAREDRPPRIRAGSRSLRNVVPAAYL